MPIENRTLTPGTILVATYKKQTYTCEVVAEGGETRFKLAGDDTLYKSPSAAASALMGGIAANGWRFFSVEGAQPAASTEKAEKAAKASKATAPAKLLLVRLIRKTPNQRGVPERSTKWFCSTCMKSFIGPATPEPSACPEGHPAQAVDELATID